MGLQEQLISEKSILYACIISFIGLGVNGIKEIKDVTGKSIVSGEEFGVHLLNLEFISG